MENNFSRAQAGEKLAGFFNTYRTVLVTVLAAFVVFVAVLGVANLVSFKTSEKDLSVIDSIEYVLTNNSSDLSDEELDARRTAALNGLAKFNGKGGITGVRANMLTAEIKNIQKDYEAAAGFWEKAASKKKNAYTAPLCLFNAATAYEELNNLDKAEELYSKAASFKDFDQAAHAKFSLGRVRESKGDKKGAVEVYTDLTEKTPDVAWAKLAKSRLIAIELADKE